MRKPERMRVRWLALAGLCLPWLSALAAPQSMYFRHVSLEHGLSQNTVTSILQDAQGFIWLGTESGLNRYDGYQVVQFNRDLGNTHGLQSDYIWALDQDDRGTIWIGTGNGGIASWDPRTERFTTFDHDPDDPLSLADDAVRTLLVDRHGMVWVGLSNRGLDRFDPATGTAVHFRHDPEDAKSLPSDSVYALFEDRSGSLWVGTDGGLALFNPTAGDFIRHRHDPADPHTLSSDQVRAIHQDHEGALWVGTFGGGLNRLNTVNGRFTRLRHDPDDAESLSHDHVRAIFEDDARRLWIGTADGLNLLRSGSLEVHRFYREQRPESLNDDYVMSIFQDRGGLLWLGTRSGGANIWNPRSWTLGHYQADWTAGTNITGFASDGDAVWVATFDKGVTELRRGNPVRRLASPQISDDRVMAVHHHDGALWLGTMGAGLDRYDLATGAVRNFRHDPEDAATLSSNAVMSLYRDRAGNIWAGTFGGGVNRLAPDTGIVTRYTTQQGLSNARATAIVEDLSGYMWIGTEAGLNRLNPETGEIQRFMHKRSDPRSLSSNTIFALHVDAAGGLWIGTSEGGLSHLANPASPEAGFTSYTQIDGLPSNLVYGIRPDSAGRLWLSSNAGLARFDPVTGNVKVFRKSHGLQGDEFNFGAHHRGEHDMLYFGGANGFNAFSPSEVEEGSQPPPVVMVGIQKMNRPAETELSYTVLPDLEINYNEVVVTFEFAALDFTSPGQNRFAYMLEGFDSGWNALTDGHRATYTNLDSGQYLFRVRAANSEGVWNETGISLPVRVHPAPWLTLWAYLGYSALAVMLIGAVARQQVMKRRREASYRQQLQHLAFIDQLTGLANRQLFTRRLRDGIEAAAAQGGELALLYVDLDDFKRINDTLGHRSGDAMLKLVGDRLGQVLREFQEQRQELVTGIGRLGGDEFVLSVRGFTGNAAVAALVQRIIAALHAPFRHEERDLVVTPSIGIAVYPRDGETIDVLMKNADTAMYEAKNAGRDDFQFYTQDMSDRAQAHLSMESALREAIERDQLWLAYQPKVDLRSLRVVGVEALVRWRHPEQGEKSPAEFIPVAERSGLIRDLDRWVIRHVTEQIRRWLGDGLEVVPVAVNLSGREFSDEDLIAWLPRLVGQAGIPARYLEIEVTEGVLMKNYEAGRAMLSRLRTMGFKASLDDFGTGYSSLGYLKNFPLSTLKIDRSFVMDVVGCEEDRAICRAIIAMAHGLGLEVVAEGIETAAQRDFLLGEGCDQGQGFGLHRPMPGAQFAALLAAQAEQAGQPERVTSLLRHPGVDGHARA